jgi:hypothetical protein
MKSERNARAKPRKINRDERRAILRSIIASTRKNGDLLCVCAPQRHHEAPVKEPAGTLPARFPAHLPVARGI